MLSLCKCLLWLIYPWGQFWNSQNVITPFLNCFSLRAIPPSLHLSLLCISCKLMIPSLPTQGERKQLAVQLPKKRTKSQFAIKLVLEFGRIESGSECCCCVRSIPSPWALRWKTTGGLILFGSGPNAIKRRGALAVAYENGRGSLI